MQNQSVYSILQTWGLRPVPLSGKAIWRDADFGYKHMGVVIGRDAAGITWVAHNHPETERVVPDYVFAAGRKVFVSTEPTLPADLVLILLQQEVNKNKPYGLVSYNCQHFTNRITKGREESQGVAGTFLAILLLGFAAAVFKNQEA